MLKIFLSSTYQDLGEARSEILKKLDAVFEGVGMEEFIPDGTSSHEICIRDLKESKIVIFLLSSNYGTLIDDCKLKEEENCKADCIMKKGEGKGYQISYTHCEYKTTIAEGILHQTYKVLDGWDTQERPEIKQFEEEFGKEMWIRIPDINDPTVVPLICKNLATKIVKWHTEDKLNFKKFIDREEVLNKIIDNIDSKIEVWGVGGVGKTALVEVALLVEKLRGKKIVTIGTTKSYKSGSGFKDFRIKCAEDQYITESPKYITLYDVVKALEKVKLISNAEELISSLQQKDKIRNYLSKFLNENKNLILFIDDFHLATEDVEKLVDSLDSIILSSRKNSNIAEKNFCITGIDEEDREDLIKLFNPNIPEQAKEMIKNIAEGHPVATKLLVKNYGKIDFDKIKDFELIDADDKQVKDFYERVIEEIFSSNPLALTLLKDLAVLNSDLPTNINRESVLNAYNIENMRTNFNSLIDTGMLKKKRGEEGTYEFYFKHIQDALEDIAVQENFERALKYYEKKREIVGEHIDDAVEILYHKVELYHKVKLNPLKKLIVEFLNIFWNIQPVHYGYKRLIEIGEVLDSECLKDPEYLKFEDLEYISSYLTFVNNLGSLYTNLKRFEEAEQKYLYTLKLLSIVANNPSLSPFLLFIATAARSLGSYYASLDRYEDAGKMYLKALNVSKQLADQHPEFLDSYGKAQDNLGNFYTDIGRYKLAEPLLLEALRVREGLDSMDPNKLSSVADTQNNLGSLYRKLEQFNEAEHAYTKALEIYRKLATENPDTFLPGLANTHNYIGNLYTNLKRFEKAELAHKEALAIRKILADKNPKVYLKVLADTQNNLGIVYVNLKNLEQAEHTYNDALEIFIELADKYPYIYNNSLANTQNNLGILYQTSGQIKEAEHAYTESLRIKKKLAEKNPDAYNPDVADTQYNLGVLYQNLKQFEQAVHAYTEALRIKKELAEKNPEVYLPKVAGTQNNLGILYVNLKKFEEAETAYQEALDIRKELAEINPDAHKSYVLTIHNNLGNLYSKLKRFEEAEKLLQEALEIDPRDNTTWYNKACLESLRKFNEKSIESLKRAIELDKKYIEMAKADEDFDNIRTSKEFKEIIGEYPVKVKEIKREFCTECGTKIKQGNKFCTNCGKRFLNFTT